MTVYSDEYIEQLQRTVEVLLKAMRRIADYKTDYDTSLKDDADVCADIAIEALKAVGEQ